MLGEDGFFYSTIADLQESTTLIKRQQKDAIKVLIDKGLIKRKRCGMPAKRYFRVLDDTELSDILWQQSESVAARIKSGCRWATIKTAIIRSRR